MIKPYVYSASGGTNPKFAGAFSAGAHAPITESRKWLGGPWAGFGSPYSWTTLTEARKSGATWYYGDHGYFGRGRFYRITRNAFQHNGCGERWRDPGVEIKPWRRSGSHVLVCPPDDKIASLMGFNHEAWLNDVLDRLHNNTDRPVKIRHRNAESHLTVDLDGVWAMVTWGSNAAVEALVFGVPVFCTGDCAASIMGRSDPINIEYPIYPDDRYEWAGVLAANQWTLDEIASGQAWEILNEAV